MAILSLLGKSPHQKDGLYNETGQGLSALRIKDNYSPYIICWYETVNPMGK